MAKQFHSKGVRVFATARDLTAMRELSLLKIEVFKLDVTQVNEVVALKEVISQLNDGKLDILINNAGVSYPYAAADVSMDKVRNLFDVNLFAVMQMVQTFLPLLLAADDACIVQIGSLAGVMPVPFGAAYNASKAALHSYNDTLRVELAPFNIRVMNAILGNVQTNLSKPWHVLPESSIYQPIKAEYQKHRIDNFQAQAAPRESVSRAIVSEVLSSHVRPWFWQGTNAWLVWFMSSFLGRGAFDGPLSNRFGLSKLARISETEKKVV